VRLSVYTLGKVSNKAGASSAVAVIHAELYGRRFQLALSREGHGAARHWDSEYRLSEFRCRAPAALVRAEATLRARAAGAGCSCDASESRHPTSKESSR